MYSRFWYRRDIYPRSVVLTDFNGLMKYTNHIQHYQIDNKYYNYFSVDKFVAQENRRRYEAIFNLIRPGLDDFILDVGSGSGPHHSILQKYKIHYYPFDVSDFNLKRLKEIGGFPISPTAGDVYELPYQSQSFHHIIVSEVLEHLDNPIKALHEIRRVLKPNGFVAISVPYKEKISYQICIHCNKPTPTNAHLHSFDTSKLKQLASQAGFKPQKVIKICNKIPNRLHINILFKKIPFSLWRIYDGFFNVIIDKPTSIILKSKKI